MNMTNDSDRAGISHMLAALSTELAPQGSGRRHETDTLFMAGPAPTEDDLHELGGFALSKDYRLIYASFDFANADAGPTAFHAVITDGVTKAVAMYGGRLWKRDRRTPAVLVFAVSASVVKFTSKRSIAVREMKGEFHEQGYALALEALKSRASLKPGTAPIFSTIGALEVVMDLRGYFDTHALAA
jgi:hypothetical protein